MNTAENLKQIPSGLPLPPGPSYRTILGFMKDFREGQLDFFDRLLEQYGDLVCIKMFPAPMVLSVKPEHYEHIFVKNADNYIKGKIFARLKAIGGNGLFFSDGDFWVKNRRLIGPYFKRGGMKYFVEAINNSCEDFYNYLEDEGKIGTEIDVSPHLAKLTLDVAGRAFFGLNIWDRTDALVKAVVDSGKMGQNLLDNPLAPPVWVPTRVNRTAKGGLKVMYDTIDELIAEGAQRGGGDDLLSKLLSHVESGEMTLSHLREEMWTLINAGHETTATTLAAVFHHLAKYPELKAEAQREVDQVLGDAEPSFDNIRQLDLLTRIVMESLRIYPPAFGTAREAVAEDVIDGYRIPKGAIVRVNFMHTQNDPRYWEEPEEFNPDRFLPEQSEARHPLAYAPFGAGGRRCAGEHFAILETVIATAMALQRYDINKSPEFELEPYLLIATRFRTGSRVTLTART